MTATGSILLSYGGNSVSRRHGYSCYGWSRQDVLDYMYANAPVQEARAVSEAERFNGGGGGRGPGQALAYKIGQLHIQGLRDKAEAALGDDFACPRVSWQVLRHGGITTRILSQNKSMHGCYLREVMGNGDKIISFKVGLALGSGAARGWAHIGVIRALEDMGIGGGGGEIQIVTGYLHWFSRRWGHTLLENSMN